MYTMTQRQTERCLQITGMDRYQYNRKTDIANRIYDHVMIFLEQHREYLDLMGGVPNEWRKQSQEEIEIRFWNCFDDPRQEDYAFLSYAHIRCIPTLLGDLMDSFLGMTKPLFRTERKAREWIENIMRAVHKEWRVSQKNKREQSVVA